MVSIIEIHRKLEFKYMYLFLGMICAALFSDDGNWYRAKVLSKTSDGYKVFYIDYGNMSVTNQLRELPLNIVELPSFAKKCSLRLPSDYTSWSHEAEEKFSQIAALGETIFIVELKEPGEHVTIDLFVDEKNILEELEPLCVKESPQTEDSNDSLAVSMHLSINEPEDFSQEIEAVISHSNAPYDFYIQLSSSLARINNISDMITRLPPKKIDIPILGTVCAAYFKDFNTYYRGLINRCTDDQQYSIFFIDYGNEIVAPKEHLMELTDEIKNISPQAIKCSLENFKCFRENSESIEKFQKIVDQCEQITIKIVDKDQSPWIIKAFENDENLCEKLNNALGNKNLVPQLPSQDKL